jgi:hypothetical protein
MLTLPSFKSIACLLIASEKKKRRLLADVLSQIGIGTVHETDTVEHAILQLRYTTIGIVIWAEDGLGYLELLKYIRHELPGRARAVPFLCITEGWNNEQLTQARNAGASGFTIFPLTLRGMLKAVSGLLGDTREFIKSEAYIGPDRRHHDLPNYSGPRRRSTDIAGGRAATQADKAPSQPPPRARPEPPPPGGMTGEAPSRANGPPAPPKEGSANKGLPPSSRRVQVVQEALRISQELQALLRAPSAGDAKAKIGEHFNRLINLMGLIHGYCQDTGETSAYFKSKYSEIMGTLSQMSFGILVGGLERTVSESSRIVDGTVSAALGVSSKTFNKMSEFDNLIIMLGGYSALSVDLLELLKTGWQNVLSLAAMDDTLDELSGAASSPMTTVATKRLEVTSEALEERRSADSQDAAFKRLTVSPR